MTAPTKNFTVIADSAIDADSPLTEDLMEELRDNDIHLEEWLGKDFTAAQNHDHDGVNSALIPGAHGGANLVVGYDRGTGNTNHCEQLCRFVPEVAWGGAVEDNTDTYLKHTGNSADKATAVSTGLTTDVDMIELVLGGVAQKSGSPLNVSGMMVCWLLFKSLSGYIKYDTYTGNGGASKAISGLGFAPKVVMVWHADTGTDEVCIRSEGLSGLNTREADGSIRRDEIISLDADGFTVGTGDEVNDNGVEYAYLAFTNFSLNGERIQIDSYTGNGGNPRTLTNSAGFAPQAVLIIESETADRAPVLAFSAQYEMSHKLSSTTIDTGNIVKFTEDGVVITNDNKVNASGKDYDIIYFLGGTRP